MKGMSIIEVVVAVAVVAIVGFTFASGLSKSLALSQQSLRTNQAAWLLEDGAEAIKSIRDSNWTTVQNFTSGTYYYAVFDNNTNLWSLTTTDPGLINGIFNRKILFTDVLRDSSDDIATSGTTDPETRYVTITASFLVGETTITKELDFYISNIFD